MRSRGWVILALGLSSAGCFDFRVPGPEDPTPVPLPRLVAVTIEYRQPNGCLGDLGHCDDNVVFFGSWMRPGGEFHLTPDAAHHVWTGTALAVPVNFPPRDTPYEVRIFDPYLEGGPSEGFTAQRLVIGGQLVEEIERPGSAGEHGLIYIDDNGFGRSPF
jgi:hypothetical protein